MTQEELNSLVKQLNISPNQILQEESEMIFLNELAKSILGTKVVFYGGTALRLAYNSPRFSEDIDLLKIKSVSFSEFKELIQKIVKSNANWALRDIKNKKQTMFALILIKEEKLKHNFSLKIELHKPVKKTKINTELLLIKSPTSILEPLLLVPSLEQIKKLKTDAVSNRKKARDIFDLWYISRLLKENFILPNKLPKYNKREFKNELQVFLPKKYYPIIEQLYAKINSKN